MIGAVIASSASLIMALLTFTWYLSGRLTRQDGWMRRVNLRIGRMEKHLGLSVWFDDDDIS